MDHAQVMVIATDKVENHAAVDVQLSTTSIIHREAGEDQVKEQKMMGNQKCPKRKLAFLLGLRYRKLRMEVYRPCRARIVKRKQLPCGEETLMAIHVVM